MSSILHSRDQLEAINAQLKQQNNLLQEQVSLLQIQVNQAQAPGMPNPSPLVEQGTKGCCAWGGTGDPLMAHTTYQGADSEHFTSPHISLFTS